AQFNDATAAQPTFPMDVAGLYDVQLLVNDGFVDSLADTVRIATGNLPPVITSTPSTNAAPGVLWNYSIAATDVDGTNFTFSLVTAPPGMTVTTFGSSPSAGGEGRGEGELRWTPTVARLGSHSVTLRVTDGEGGTADQSFTLVVAQDSEAPTVAVSLIQGQLQPETGQWAAQLGSTAIFRVTGADNAGVPVLTLRVGSLNVSLDNIGVGSITATTAGLLPVVATATDAAGNVGATNSTILFHDPNAVSAIGITIHSPTNSELVTKPVAIVASITNASDLLSYRVDFARAADVNLDNISVEGPQFTVLTNVTLPPGTRRLTNAVLARFDPTILLNDDYLIRVVASDGPSLQYEGAVVSVSGNLKFGELRLEFTDLAVPLAGLPIAISRVYDSRDSRRSGDFGFGWSLGIQDAVIRESVPATASFRPGTRVNLTAPDGRRLGFTFAPTMVNASLFGALFEPKFEPDAGIYEKLEVPGGTFSFAGAGIIGDLSEALGPYNPSTYYLTTRDGTRYEYDQSFGLQTVTDLNTNRLVYTRDGIFHFSSGSTNADQSIPFIRDDQGRITQIIDPAGNTLNYTYDARGDLRSFADQTTNITQYHYSTARAHYLTNIIDPLGRQALRMEYDAAGRLVSITDALGNPIQQNCDVNSKVATYRDANGNTNIVRYDDNGNELMRVIPGVSTNFAYDANNNPLASTNGRGFRPTSPTTQGNQTSITDSLGNRTSIAYNAQNKPQSVTNALGQTLGLHYDSAGKLLVVVNNLGYQTTVTRDTAGRVASLTDAVGNTTQFDYSDGCACGKPGKIINPDGSFRLYEYNAQGLTNRMVNELGAETLFGYDDGGRLLWIRDPLSNYTRFFYSGPLLTNVVDALGRQTRYEYDALNRTNRIIDAQGGIVEFRYDANGNRTHVIDPVTNVTVFAYDTDNRLKHQVDPLGHTNFFAYDAAGNRIEAIDRNGRRRTFAYDAVNRMTNELWWEGTNIVRSIVFGFNGLGVQTLAMDPAARYDYDYDDLNRLAQVRQSAVPGQSDFTLDYTYNALGQIESVTDHWGVRVGSAYDTRNRLARRTWNGPGVDPARVDFAYDVAGNRTRTDRYADLAAANRIGHTTNAYNNAGIVTNITHLGPALEVLAKYDYTIDAAYQITRWSINNQLSTFNYDLTGQLTNALNTAQPSENFRYDANGNRINAQSSGNYVVGRNNQILSDGTNNYAYDLEGQHDVPIEQSDSCSHALQLRPPQSSCRRAGSQPKWSRYPNSGVRIRRHEPPPRKDRERQHDEVPLQPR
ncbi:MAG: hypothetical protein IPK15_22420, partial [Verrucomicrobia bacterium]|nr:hypothetical protein [Verrucomicrobiota bacterium]